MYLIGHEDYSLFKSYDFWHSKEPILVCPPQVKVSDLLKETIKEIDNTIWIRSSGSQEGPKWIGLPKEGFLVSAKEVNEWIQLSNKDVWLSPLPFYHVGGLSVFARCFLASSESKNFNEKWSPFGFIEEVKKAKATLSSLVPTQVFDLVETKQKCPKSLRAVFVGGGELEENLYLKSRELGWPLLPTYGMTECCSQVASAKLASLDGLQNPALHLMPHIEGAISNTNGTETRGLMVIKSPSLFNIEVREIEKRVDVKERRGEFFTTQDFVELSNGKLKFVGRSNDRVKVGGALINLNELNRHWPQQSEVLFASPNYRLENQVDLLCEEISVELLSKVQEFNIDRVSAEKIRNIYQVDSIPRTSLGKLNRPKLLKRLGLS